ncbi:MAG: hypothetical protein QOE98_1750 [Gaiellaceae bacterium]|nr:hypothetical protein [Gaiellaceae bacterium]
MAVPLRWVYGNVCFGPRPDDAWALFVAALHPYAGLGPAAKQRALSRLVAAVEAAEADLQILRVARALDVERYRTDVTGQPVGHPEAHARLLDEHAALLDGARAAPFVTLAVRLAEPDRDVATQLSRAAERGPRGWLDALRRAAGGSDRRLLAASELERLRVAADAVHARLADFLDVRPARTVEVQWLVRRAFCRGLGEPDVDGLHEPQALVFERNGHALLMPQEADVLRWMDGLVEHRARLLRIDSELGTSWQAHLAVGALPERAGFPAERLELMFAVPESLPFGVDVSLGARYLPNELALRMVRRRVQDADQIARAEAEGDQGVSDQGHERTQLARDLLAHLQATSRPPLLRATLAVAVAAADPETLEDRVRAVRRAFGDIRLHRPAGEQLTLFNHHLPAQRGRARGYDDVLTAEQVAAMMPTAGHDVGSRRGLYLGHTLTGARQPVLFDLREGSATDRPTTILAVGSLGSGKTILTQTLLYHAFLQGARIVDPDPKGDHRFQRLPDVAPHTETITLAPDPALRGLLDPLRVAPVHLRQDAAVSFLCDLLPARCDAAWITAIVKAVDTVLRRAGTPTCLEVVHALEEGDAVDEQVAKTLRVYARSGLTQLGFASPEVTLPAVGERQVTYIPIRDLPAPQPDTARSEYSQSERVAEQIVRLIALFAMHLMAAERDRLKVFSFDEGWRLLQDPAGRLLLSALQRMGRSELAVPIISTQLVSDAVSDREALDNLVGATFVFGMRSEREAARALALLGLDADDERERRRLLELEAGACLMRDHRGRIEAVQVDVPATLLDALSTTPTEHPPAEDASVAA